MRLIFGLLFMALSFIGIAFFRNYRGSVISYPALWYTAFIVLGLLGVWLIYSVTNKVKKNLDSHIETGIAQLKSNAVKIVLDFDKCEFKSGSFSQEVEMAAPHAIGFFAPGSLNFKETVKENVVQSYLVYTDSINGENSRFISQSFPFDITTLKFYVLKNSIALYVDRFDSGKYLFDFKDQG